MSIRITARTEQAAREIENMRKAFDPAQVDVILAGVAARTQRALVEKTPKRWTGQVRRGWITQKSGRGYIVTNSNIVMLFIEEGTKAHGPVTGATQRPWAHDPGNVRYGKAREALGKSFRAKMLYIPLNASAAIGGWRPGLKYGTDYVLARWVRGMKALHIVRDQRKATELDLLTQAKAYIERIKKG